MEIELYEFEDKKNTTMIEVKSKKAIIQRDEFLKKRIIGKKWGKQQIGLFWEPFPSVVTVARVTKTGNVRKFRTEYVVKYLIWRAETSENWEEKANEKLKTLKKLLDCQSIEELEKSIKNGTIQKGILLETISILFSKMYILK